MDSDDVISQEQGQRLRKLVYGPHARGIDGYVMQVHCLSFVEGEITIVDHVKIFRNLPCYRFEHRIHEQILPAIRRQGNSVAFAEIHVVHSGSMQTEEIRKRKLERDFRILQLDIERFPDHPFVLFNLGMTYEDSGNFQQAEECLLKSIRFANEEESHLRKAWALLISCQRQQGKMQSAIETAAQAKEIVSSMRFPPTGSRSWGSFAAGQSGYSSPNDFINPICWALIESISALNEVQEIVQVEGIDGIYVGRFDLALSMSISPQDIESDKILNKQIETILKHAQAGGLPTGTSGEFSKLLDQGFRILTVRSELELLSVGLQKYLED